MLTDEDIKKLIEAEQEVFPTKTDFESFKESMREDFSNLQASVDDYAVLHHSVRCWSKVFHKKVLTRF